MAISMVFTLAACGEKKVETADKTPIRVAALKGPTAMSMVKLMDMSEKEETAGNYVYTLATAPDEVTGKLISGEIDIAAVPTNLSSVLYNKTEGKIQVAALNTLGVLYVVENGDSVKTFADLAGKNIAASGLGAVPEYAFNYLLAENGITDATVSYKTEHAECAALLASGQADVAVLPEPFVTSALAQNPNLRVALDLTAEWEKVAKDESALAMGCIVVQKDFAEKNPQAVADFLKEYKQSAEYATNEKNVNDCAALIEKYGIIKAAVAEKALPNCNIVFMEGAEMKATLSGFLQVLFDANPKAVGGKMPLDDFYYEAK